MSNQNKVAKQGRRNANRPRPLPPDVTARNLAYEKQRRQTFNDDLVNLARLVPALAQARRLSKVLIVNESIRHLRQRRTLCISAAKDMQELLAENSRLASELNALRAQIGGAAMPRVEPKPATETMVQLMDIENEEAGEFPEGFGQTWAGRSSPPSKDKGAQSENETRSVQESASPEQNGPRRAQAPEQDVNMPLGYFDTPLPDSGQTMPSTWDIDLSLSNQPQASLASGPELFGPTETIPVDHMATDIPRYLDAPIDASPVDLQPESWTDDLGLDHHGSGNTARRQSAVNQNFEDLWNFWVGPRPVTF